MIKVLGSGKIRFSFDTGQVCDVLFQTEGNDNVTMATVFHGTNTYKMGADSLVEFLFRKSREARPAENEQPVKSRKKVEPTITTDPGIITKKKRGRPRKNP